MDVFSLTRALVDIESITGNEERVGDYLINLLNDLVRPYGGVVEKIQVEPGRSNVFAAIGEPVVTLSTHLDTVPPFFPSRDDGEFIWGRGACDVKGIIASMLCATERLLAGGVRNFGLLFVVGEERNSAGAYHAALDPRGSKFIINGEPTENKLAVGSKGALRFELKAHGRMAHSAYPELGESAIEKLLDVLARVRAAELPHDPTLGPCTLNIGLLSGGRAPNVIPDAAEATLMYRLVGDAGPVRQSLAEAVAGQVEIHEILCIPALHLGALDGFETTVVAYTTDIPAFNGAWGKPYLLGPGSIHVAHTSQERVSKAQLQEATTIYETMVKRLLTA